MELSPARLGALLLRNRRTVRAPVPLYRAGLGWLFGSRMMMLEHVGRRTGESRSAVLEVIGRPAPDRIRDPAGRVPTRRVSGPEEIGDLAAMLATSAAGHLTATTVFADGRSMHGSVGF